MNGLGTALLAGLIGALISALLSYVVRLRAKRKEDEDERKRLALVNFLLLTNTVASDHLMKHTAGNMLKIAGVKAEEGFSHSHSVAGMLASKIVEMKPEELEHVHIIMKPFISAAVAAIDKFDVNQSDLGHMSEVTIYMYHRYKAAAMRLQTTLGLLDGVIEKKDPKLLDATVLHSVFTGYRAFADAAAILRAAFGRSAGVSDTHSVDCLIRSYKAMKSEIYDLSEDGSRLKKALAAQSDAAMVDAVKAELKASQGTPPAT